MKKIIKFELRWTKKGDRQQHQRSKIISCDLPVMRENEVSDLLLRLPDTIWVHRYSWPEALDAEPELELIAQAIDRFTAGCLEKEKAEKEKAEKEKAEKEKAEKEKEKKEVEKRKKEKQAIAALVPMLVAALDDEDYAFLRSEIVTYEGSYRVKRTDQWVRDRELTIPGLPLEVAQRLHDWAAWNEKEPERKKEKREKYIADWAEKHGSDRLKKQIGQGFVGWPLFLHEKIEHDFAGVHEDRKVVLDKDDSLNFQIENPCLEYLECGEKLLAQAKKLEQELEIDYCRYDCDDKEHSYDCVTLEGYLPGPADIFEKEYNLRLRVSDYESIYEHGYE